jgi:hypothetical protein
MNINISALLNVLITYHFNRAVVEENNIVKRISRMAFIYGIRVTMSEQQFRATCTSTFDIIQLTLLRYLVGHATVNVVFRSRMEIFHFAL